MAIKFDGKQVNIDKFSGLYVIANHDAVIKNERSGRPLKIGTKEFNRGLYCHAFSKTIVRLPSPAETFYATIGIDSNEQTSGGRGSVIFSVIVDGQEKFRSQVIREGMPGVDVNVDLNGATEFVLQIDPTPDGISCDQSDWADARVKLKSGETIRIADLHFEKRNSRYFLPTRTVFICI